MSGRTTLPCTIFLLSIALCLGYSGHLLPTFGSQAQAQPIRFVLWLYCNDTKVSWTEAFVEAGNTPAPSGGLGSVSCRFGVPSSFKKQAPALGIYENEGHLRIS